ncbi:MAG: hypothetical protein R3C20_17530 [Planctomycetaceae bacterium]
MSTHLVKGDTEDSPNTQPAGCPENSGATVGINRADSGSFIENFFQEKNIRWMLGIGAAIVFSCSLMLVTRQWQEWSVAEKFLTVLGYTGVLFVSAEVGRKRLGLKLTTSVLHSLCILLMPVCFLALSWLSAGEAAQSLSMLQAVGLMIPASIMAWLIGTRVFDQLLNGRQMTFVVSYFLLCLFGALPHARIVAEHLSLSDAGAGVLATVATLVFWVTMSAGVLKVNRHIFWLTEEHRKPRIFGFAPIALLGIQFVLLVCTKTLGTQPIQWFGLALVLLAATVFQTARTIAAVFRQRTGGLMSPMPASIIVPIYLGLALTAAGVCLSFHSFHFSGPTTFAVVPTCIIAAGVMALAARDTGHAAFVWCSLICTTIAYQCAPTLMGTLVQQLKDSAASAVQEQRLPVAFYGITYLPLVAVLATVARKLRLGRYSQFCPAVQQFATALVLICFAVSLSHVKAAFLIPCLSILTFGVLAVVFTDRRYVLGSIAALIIATATANPFAAAMRWSHTWDASVTATYLIGLSLLLVLSSKPDRLIQQIPLPAGRGRFLFEDSSGNGRRILQNAGLSMGCVFAVLLSGIMVSHMGEPWTGNNQLQFIMVMCLLGLQTMRDRTYQWGMIFWLLATVAATSCIHPLDLTFVELVRGISVIGAGISSLCLLAIRKFRCNAAQADSLRVLRQRLIASQECSPLTDSRTRIAEAFVVPLCDLSLFVTSCLAVIYHLPSLLATSATLGAIPASVSTMAVVVWLFVIGQLIQTKFPTVVGATLLPLLCTGLLCTFAPSIASYEWYPAVWSTSAGLMLATNAFRGRNQNDTLRTVAMCWLTSIALLSFALLSLPVRTAGLVAMATLYAIERKNVSPAQRAWFCIGVNIHLLLLLAKIAGCTGHLSLLIFGKANTEILPVLLPALAASILVFDRSWRQLDETVTSAWAIILRVAAALGLLLIYLPANNQSLFPLPVITGSVLIAIAEFRLAIRNQSCARVWNGLVLIAMMTAYLVFNGIISIGAGVAPLLLLFMSAAALRIAFRSAGDPGTGVFSLPLQTTGLALTALASILSAVRGLTGAYSPFAGFNSLILFFAAGICFHQWMLTHRRTYAVAAGFIVNLSLMVTWNTLNLKDAQLYLVPLGLSLLGLVELLRKELPDRLHDPLRYVGSLTILVSPVFQILHGSWLHLLSLLVLCVVVILLSIGLRLRVLVYTGSAFLIADLIAIVVRGSVDHPALLWVSGVGVGISVIALAAFCESHREKVLQKIRFLTAQLATWE